MEEPKVMVQGDKNYNFPVELQPIYLDDSNEILGKKAVVRTDTKQALGIVSNGYGLVHHGTVVDAIREATASYETTEKLDVTMNGAFLFLSISFPRIQQEVKTGDFIRLMMIIRNSYNGMHRLQVIFGAFRLVCSNGMVLGKKFTELSYRHMSSKVEALNKKSIMEQYSTVSSGYIKLFEERGEQISVMARTNVTQEPKKLFSPEFAKLPKYLLKEAEHSFEAENDRTAWGYYNALTYAVTHKKKVDNPALDLEFGVEAWKAAEKIL